MKKLNTILLITLTLILSLVYPSGVSAEEAEIDLSGIDALAQGRVDSETTAGVTVLVKRGSYILYHKSFGYAHKYDRTEESEARILLENPRLMSNDTLYDLASVTKVAATTQAMMMLVSQGLVDIDEPVATYMPEFAVNGKENITPRDLLTHTSGLAQWQPTYLYTDTREGEREIIMNQEIELTPGVYRYSDIGFKTLGFLIETITEMPLEDYLQENLYGPLGMNDTMFVPLENGVSKDRIAATSLGNPYEWRMSNERDWPGIGYNTAKDQDAFDAFDGWRNYTLIGEVNDGNSGMANEGVAGHAGLFSTAYDLSILGEMMLNGGTYNGHTFYDEATFELFTTPDPERSNRGLGWARGSASSTSGYTGPYSSDRTFSHDGFTGTQVIFDKDYDLQIIVLSNKQNVGPYNDHGSYYSTYAMSREISELAYRTVIDASEVADKDALQNLFEETNLLDLSNYVTNSTEGLEKALADAFEVLEHEYALQMEIDAVYTTLLEHVNSLVLKGDKTELGTLIQEAEAIELDEMTEASVLGFNEALSNAKNVMSDEEATQEEIDVVLLELESAIEGLVKVVEEAPAPSPEPTPDPQPESELPATGSMPIVTYIGLSMLGLGLILIVFRKRRII